MPRLYCLAFLYLLALLAPAQARGNSRQDQPTSSAAVSNAGAPVLSLNGPWKFRTGDSPKPTGTQVPLWAQADYDDSSWQDYILDPKHSAVTAADAMNAEEVPGWQSH